MSAQLLRRRRNHHRSCDGSRVVIACSQGGSWPPINLPAAALPAQQCNKKCSHPSKCSIPDNTTGTAGKRQKVASLSLAAHQPQAKNTSIAPVLTGQQRNGSRRPGTSGAPFACLHCLHAIQRGADTCSLHLRALPSLDTVFIAPARRASRRHNILAGLPASHMLVMAPTPPGFAAAAPSLLPPSLNHP